MSRFKFWRKIVGGRWSLIGPSPATPWLGFMWVRGMPMNGERVYAYEDWK